MATQQGVIKSFMAALDKTTLKGTAALDAAIKSATNNKFSSVQAVIDQMITDQKKSSSADDFLQRYCGIILGNTDTGAITGSDAGGTTAKTSESVVPESGALKNFTGNSFTVNGLTFTLEKSFKNLSAKEQFIWQGLYTWWAKGALDLIKTSYGFSFTDSDVYFKKITVSFVDDSSTTLLAWNDWYDPNLDGKVDRVTLVVNMRYYKNIDTTNPNGYSSATDFYLDKVLAHELTHTIMYAKILDSENYPKFIKEGLAELTSGIDDVRSSVINSLANNSSLLLKNLNGTSTTSPDSAGYMFFRYLAKQAAGQGVNTTNNANNKKVTGTAANDTIENYGSKATIDALDGNDSIGSYGANSSVSGGDGNDTINNTSKGTNVTILGGAGNDSVRNSASAKIDGGAGNDTLINTDLGGKATLNGGAGADYITTYNADNVSISGGDDADKIELFGTGKLITVSGGKGNDSISIAGGTALIQYANGDGNDVIQGVTKEDTISITGAEYTSSVKGNDVILGVGNSSVRLTGAKNIAFTVKGTLKSNGTKPSDPKLITGTAGNDTINNSVSGATIQALGGDDRVYNTGTKTQIYAGAGKDSVFNHAATVTIDGGNDADYLSNFKGSVSMVGGAGNDSLFNEDVNVTMDGGNDKDYIRNFGNKSLIRGGAGNDSIFNEGATVTIDGGDGADHIANYGAAASMAGGNGNDSIWGDAGADTILGDAGNDRLYGDAGNDKIYGGAGNDTLWGSDGNDSLWGDAGADKFIYYSGEGKDVIFGFDNSDMLQITGTFTGTYNTSAKTIAFTVGSTANAITLKDFTATTFNINGSKYRISGTKLVK